MQSAQQFQREAGVAGMRQAVEHADAVRPAWSSIALDHVRDFALHHAGREPFLGEDIRAWAEQNDCPTPPDGRAWGAVIKAAARSGLIRKTGEFRKVKLSGHDSKFGPLWIAGGRA
jgi:hypothetical protein